jgi:hypothetical protein
MSTHRPRHLKKAAVVFIATTAVAGTAFLWQGQGADSSTPAETGSTRPPSFLESPADFDAGVTDVLRDIDDSDSVLLDGRAFDRAVAEASK